MNALNVMDTYFTLFGKSMLIFVDFCGIIYNIKIQKESVWNAYRRGGKIMCKRERKIDEIKRLAFEQQCKLLTIEEILETVGEKYNRNLNPIRHASWPDRFIDPKVEKQARKALGKNFRSEFKEFGGRRWTSITW